MFLLGAEVEREEMKSNKSYAKGQKYQEEILKECGYFFACIPTPITLSFSVSRDFVF